MANAPLPGLARCRARSVVDDDDDPRAHEQCVHFIQWRSQQPDNRIDHYVRAYCSQRVRHASERTGIFAIRIGKPHNSRAGFLRARDST